MKSRIVFWFGMMNEKKMKRPRGEPNSPPSLFPHEVRRRTIVALLCIWRLRRQEQPLLALVPRDVVRMICGWVKADFSVTLYSSIGGSWKLFQYQLGYSDTNIWALTWINEATIDYNIACEKCLCFPYNTRNGGPEIEWTCKHDSGLFWCHGSMLKKLGELSKKYLLDDVPIYAH